MKAITLFIHTNYKTIQRVIFGILLLGLGGYFAGIAFISKGVLEPGDGIVHYTIARYAPQKPALFLDHWGKPLFTLLSSPFAQMGFPGMIVFNVILYTITSIFIFSWAEKRKNPFAWLTPLLLISSLIYFDMVNAGMTEILFATILTATVYLFFNEKYILGAIIFSFSIFSRPEGMIIMPVFILFLIWKKRWISIPFLALGFIIYSIIGYFYFKDFLWYIHNNPYPAKVPFYGQGGLFSFIKSNQAIWGPFMTVFCIVGSAWIVISLFTKKRSVALHYLFLVILPGLAVLFVHSYIWWKGIHGSLGLVRVISTIVPLFVILSLGFLNSFKKELLTLIIPPNYLSSVIIVIGVLLGTLLFTQNKHFTLLPVVQTPHQQLASQAAEWYNKQPHTGKLYYSDHYFTFKAGINRFDSTSAEFYFLDKNDPANNLHAGDFLVWDTHFSPNDGDIPREKITENPRIEVLKIFTANEPILGNENYPYEIIMSRVK